jgi:hypothetical protein
MDGTMALAWREKVWAKYVGHEYQGRCYTVGCTSVITPFQFSLGCEPGAPSLDEVKPICAVCARHAKRLGSFLAWNEWCQKNPRYIAQSVVYVPCQRERMWRCFYGESLSAHCLHCLAHCSVFTFIEHRTVTCQACITLRAARVDKNRPWYKRLFDGLKARSKIKPASIVHDRG